MEGEARIEPLPLTFEPHGNPMKKVTLSCFAALTCLGLAIPSPSAGTSDALAAQTFVREPIIIFTSERVTPLGVQSSSLIVYQDGFVTASRSGDSSSGFVPSLLAVDVGLQKARSGLQSNLERLADRKHFRQMN